MPKTRGHPDDDVGKARGRQLGGPEAPEHDGVRHAHQHVAELAGMSGSARRRVGFSSWRTMAGGEEGTAAGGLELKTAWKTPMHGSD